jgi:hypothetical protein
MVIRIQWVNPQQVYDTKYFDWRYQQHKLELFCFHMIGNAMSRKWVSVGFSKPWYTGMTGRGGGGYSHSFQDGANDGRYRGVQKQHPLLRAPRAAGARNICVIRGLHDAHRTRIMRQIHAGFTADARHIRESDATVACTCRATSYVTFGPLCTNGSRIAPSLWWCHR